jgi:hypothetical protein
MHTMEFGQAYCKDIFRRVHTKFTLYFFYFYTIYHEIWNLK